MEMGRIQQAKEQAIQIQEDKKSRLKAEYEKERDEMCKKYDMLLQHYEMVLAQKEKDFGTHYKKLYVNKLLAETFRQGYEGDKVGLSGTQEANVPGFMNEITLSSAICCEE